MQKMNDTRHYVKAHDRGPAALIVTGAAVQRPAVEAAHALGLQAIVTDRDPDCACAGLADLFFPLDIYDVKGHVKLVRDLRGVVDLRAVFTAAADPILTVAHAAREAGLHHVPVDTAIACASKSVTRTRLLINDVPQPEFALVGTADEAREAVVRIGKPCIVKATGSAGGKGHTKVQSTDDVTPEIFDLAIRYSKAGIVLVEELLDGLELSAEALWWNGAMFPLNAVERPFAHRFTDAMRHAEMAIFDFLGRDFEASGWQAAIERGHEVAIELGHYNPAILAPATWDEVWDVVERTGHAIGLDKAAGGHIHKVDLICTAAGIKVLETTVRLSGNWDSGATSPLAHGVNYTLGALKLALGQPPDWSLFAPRWHRHAVCLFKFVEPGKVRSFGGDHDGIDFSVFPPQPKLDHKVITRYGIGDTIPPLDSYSALAAWVIADGATRTEAVGKAYRALCGLRYEVE